MRDEIYEPRRKRPPDPTKPAKPVKAATTGGVSRIKNLGHYAHPQKKKGK